jgi:ribosomal protein S18 acetylase RimI-like enzyme
MKTIRHKDQTYSLRLATDADVPSLRSLVNAAYKELSDMGLNYTATYQDEETTRQRMQKGRVFVLKLNGAIVATILFSAENYFTKRKTAYVGQFGVSPELKKRGLGTLLMDYCEDLARAEGFEGLQLDTAQPAVHLVEWYKKRGYVVVGETHWEGKTYDSFVFEKVF